MKKLLTVKNLLILLIVTTCQGLNVFGADGGVIETKLFFSTDNGQNFSNDFPIVKKGSEVLIKVNYEVKNEHREIKNNVLTTIMFNCETDFASANSGKQNWGREAWFQRIKTYWGSPKKPGTFIYRLKLGSRPEGEIGSKNKWDKSKRKFIDGPLPPCQALAQGEYRFIINIKYNLDNGESVSKDSEFIITIK